MPERNNVAHMTLLRLLLTCSLCLGFLLSPNLVTAVLAQSVTEPDQPHLRDDSQITFAVRRTFTDGEMQQVEKGRLAFTCQFDSLGNMQQISLSHVQGFKLSALNEQILKLNLRKYVKLYVPKAFRSPKTAHMRKVGLHYVGKSFRHVQAGTKN